LKHPGLEGFCMSRVALGTVQFGLSYGVANQVGQVSRASAKAMLELAAGHGVDTLDTAIAYGESEACLGEAGTGRFKVVSKLPALPDGCTAVDAWVQEQLALSLARLGACSLYGLLLHRPDQLLEAGGAALYRALQRLKETGQVEKIGISIYDPRQLDILLPPHKFDLVQAPLNLVDRRLHASGWLQRLKDEGVEVHTRSAFLQGLLLMPKPAIPARFAPWTELWDRWHAWLASHELSAVQACLAYPLSLAGVSRVVVGADSVGQLSEILLAGAAGSCHDFPDLQCDAEDLINPARWSLS
jgi:aryl-alcohol dehydrogenase-like predicted oxidoreductase